MDEKTLLWLASGFRTVSAWRDAMFAHGYTMPPELCHGLSGAMKRLNLKFPAAFRMLWDKKKIGVSGRALLYDPSAAELWDAGSQSKGDLSAEPVPSAVAWDRDVLTLVSPTEEIVWRVSGALSPAHPR